MDTLSSFIPIDRRQAGAAGAPLPDRATGAALLADLSDFTPLTEALTTAYGPQRGAEEITAILQRVYDPLIAAIDSYRGSVVTFSGDALTAWFDADDGRRATTCALALQAAVAALPPVPLPGGAAPHRLGLKVAVAAGRVRRFLVGDPAIQVLDTLAGATLDWLAAAERLAQPGEVVLDPATAAALGAGRPPAAPAPPVDLPTGPPGAAPVRYVVVPGLAAPAAPAPWPEPPAAALPPAAVRPWLLPAVWDRLQSGQGEFLSDLRPVVTLFLHFTGIDYDLPDAGAQLDAYIRGVQEILARYAGSLLGVILGDKGNYLYAAFGAPLAHAGDAGRAAAAALELGATLPAPSGAVQIGLAGGQVWAGAYGGQGRRAYGVLGDAVNLGARLMQAAAPGQILVSGPTRQAAGDAFAWQSLPPLQVKGKAAPVPVLALTGAAPRPIQLLEPAYRLPLVGRDAELALVAGRLARAQGGHGQIVGLTAEAGMGKSRLVAAVAGLAARAGLTGYGGAGQAYGTNTPYLAWGSIWRAFFGLDPAAPVATQMRALARALARCDPALLPRLPLLGVVLDLPLPENDLTRSLDPGLRKASLESLLIDCLRSRVRQGPLLLVLEDSHWLDPLSHDLLEAIGRAIATLPVLLVLAYRPLDLPRLQAPRISTLPYFTEVPLADLTPAEAARLIALQLGETLGAAAPVPPALVARVTDRAGGNPFFIEELLNYIRDQGRDLHDPAALAALDLPGSLHSLLLSRIDR
ncbi:MAG TPA: AAA family ATPase, partial [Chloroflexia bacterium]|nr:AAA family ATPase [Chloroflexia bacterium]